MTEIMPVPRNSHITVLRTPPLRSAVFVAEMSCREPLPLGLEAVLRDCMLDLGLSRLLVCRKALEIHLFCYEVLVSGMDAAHFVYVSDLLIQIFFHGCSHGDRCQQHHRVVETVACGAAQGLFFAFLTGIKHIYFLQTQCRRRRCS